MLEEKWKKVDWIDGYCGTLEVSNLGRVRATGRSYSQRTARGGVCTSRKPDRILASYVSAAGYPTIALRIRGGRPKFTVHRLVARAFVPGYDEDMTVNHINGIKTDNRAVNLEWVTLARNTVLQWQTGLINMRGENHPSSKLTADDVRLIRSKIAAGIKKAEIARQMGISSGMVTMIDKRRRWASL